MFFSIKPRNATERYPQLLQLPVEMYVSKDGSSYCIIDIKDITDLLSLDAACRNTDEFYKGLFVKGTEITIAEEAYTLGE